VRTQVIIPYNVYSITHTNPYIPYNEYKYGDTNSCTYLRYT